MSIDTLSGLLRQFSFLSNINNEALREISLACQYEMYEPDTTVSMHDIRDALWLVLSGQVTLLQENKVVFLKKCPIVYAAGQHFESSHRIDERHATHLITDGHTELIKIDRPCLDNVLLLFLRTIPIFQHIPQEQLQVVAREVRLESYSPGETLFEQGDSPDALYIVESGEVAMIHYFRDRAADILEEEEIASYRQGGSFGERGVLGKLPRAGRAVIREQTSLLVLPADVFQGYVTQHPEIAFSLYRYLSAQLEEHLHAYRQSTRDVDKIQEVMQSTKMAALGQLVAGVAHEINTPVGSISSNGSQLKNILLETSSLYKKIPQLIEEYHERNPIKAIANRLDIEINSQIETLFRELMIQQIQDIQTFLRQHDIDFLMNDMLEIANELGEASDRIRNMVKSLASFARLEEAELKTVNVHEGLDSTLALLHHELKYRVDVEKDYKLTQRISCYPNQLNQVFMNILMNAIQALNIDKLRPSTRGFIHIRTYQEEGWAVIAIKDNGCGISSEKIDDIFEPFFSTKGAAAAAGGLGLGLGLSISQQIIEKHLGKLRVTSQEGKGTIFYIELPLDRTTPNLIN